MRITATFLSILILFSSCSHSIMRSGYNGSDKVETKCNVEITKDKSLIAANTKPLGSIRLGDTGFSTNCSEIEAMMILRNEACQANANLVVITDEKLPSLLSSCYICEAIFYHSDELPKLDSIDAYKEDLVVTENIQAPEKQNAAVQILAYAGGFVLGYFLAQVLFGGNNSD